MPKILVIEDEAVLLEPLCEMLRAEAYEVIGTTTGETGLTLALAERPDVILCDIVLPGMDGYAVFSRLGQDPRTQPIPVVFLTGQVSRREQEVAKALGVDAYLCKPATRRQILATIRQQLDKPAAPAPRPD